MSDIEQLIKTLESKIIVILGLGREGRSTYTFLRENLPDKKLYLVDQKTPAELGRAWQEINEEDNRAEFATNLDVLEQELVGAEKILIIKTPGLPPSSPLMKQVEKLGAKVTSNTNLFFQLVDSLVNQEAERKSIKSVRIVGITGTKGKSTVAAMTHHILKNCGTHSFLGGNIGIPPLSLWPEVEDAAFNNLTNKPVVVVLELSSHQLSDLKISPSIAIILDISPEHLDYYDTFNDYINAKSQISKFQQENDLVIFNDKFEIPTKLANLGKARQLAYDFEKNVQDNNIVLEGEKIIDIDQLPVIGKHNVLNSIPPILVAKELGCQTFEINRSLKTFNALPHRLEIVSNHNGIAYVNDSLSTTPKSTIAAIKSFHNSPIILIAGGYERNLDFSELGQIINEHNIKHLVLLPDTGEKILQSVEKSADFLGLKEASITKHTFVNSMRRAVMTAKSLAETGDIVLLSPASASFGYFKDYQDRGDQFKKFVSEQ